MRSNQRYNAPWFVPYRNGNMPRRFYTRWLPVPRVLRLRSRCWHALMKLRLEWVHSINAPIQSNQYDLDYQGLNYATQH